MHKNKLLGRFALMAIIFMSAQGAALAQATRTWVSGVGDDANPCSRTAPCKTFAGAISKTAARGEISVLDPGGYGGVTITKSITINNTGGEAGVLVSGTNGIVINAAATDRVILRGLTIEGLGTGLSGIRILSAAEVVVDNCQIQNFRGTSPSYGILLAPSAGWSRLTLLNSTVLGNGQTAAGNAGIGLKPSGSGVAIADINHAVIANNGSGVIADANGTTGAAWATIRDSQIQGNYIDGVLATSASTAAAKIAINDSNVANNGFTSALANAAGIKADGASTQVRIEGNVITVNKNGVLLANSGVIYSYGGNIISGNSVNGTFTSTQPTQ